MKYFEITFSNGDRETIAAPDETAVKRYVEREFEMAIDGVTETTREDWETNGVYKVDQ